MHFEAVKIAMKQDRNGVMVTLAIHPNNVPPDLFADWVGSRYQVAMVRVGDNEEPLVPASVDAGRKAVARAGMLCRNEKFQQWLYAGGYAREASEAEAITALHSELGVTSRHELATNRQARDRMDVLIEQFRRRAVR